MLDATYKSMNDKANLFFLILPFFRPDSVSLAPEWLNSFFIAWRILSFLLGLYYFIKIYSKGTISNGDIVLIILYELAMMCSVVVNRVPLSSRIINIANFLGIYFIFYVFSIWNPKELINVTFEILSIFIYLNAALTIAFPRGLNNAASDTGRINFLGLDNTITLYFILAIALAVLYQNIHHNSKKPFVLLIVIVLSELFYKSGSGLVSLFLIIAYMVLCGKSKNLNKFSNVKFLILVYTALETAIVFLNRIQNLQFVFEILGKSSTFTDRRFYWNHAISQIMLNPILGQGSGTVDLWNNGYYSHNAFLDVLLKGGLVAAVLWIFLIYHSMNLNRMKGNCLVMRLFRILIFAALIYGLMEGLEDRIAFNALLSVSMILPRFEEKNCILNITIKVV